MLRVPSFFGVKHAQKGKMHKDLPINGSAEGGILFNCIVAQSVEATNVRRNNA
jgi:hypothetical protein